MKKLLFFLIILSFMIIPSISSIVDNINYPYNNDIISYSARIQLNVSSSASTGCYFTYSTSLGPALYNQSVECNGISLVDLPNANGEYNLTVTDDVSDSQTITIKVEKPAGILVTMIYFFSFLILLFMLFIFIINLAKLATINFTIFDVAKSLTIYFGLLISYQLVIEYVGVPFIIDWLDLIRSISGWIMVVLPIISFFITFFVKGTKKKKMLSIQEMTGSLKFNGS